MDSARVEENLIELTKEINEDSFIYDLLIAYGQPKSTITRLKKGSLNQSKNNDEIIWKKKLLFRKVADEDLHVLIDQLRNDPVALKHQPRFIILTDFSTLLAVDTKTNETLDIPIKRLTKHFDFFLPWAGMEKIQHQNESQADIKAAERMGRLYDIILQDNKELNETKGGKHILNIFLSRLLFCFFAEDTEIFFDGQFTNSIASHTVDDGSDLKSYLEKLFKVLNLKKRSNYPQFLQEFPYVNGGLFADDFPVPILSRQARKFIIEAGTLDWAAINPDIFGSMMQAVVHHSERGDLGMHYTSVENIMKVIRPLFLDDLYEELEKADNNERKLEKLLGRLYHLRLFDPACGSGNFLIISYKKLCKLEIEIFRQLRTVNPNKWKIARSGIRLNQFYGIEIDDFAYETTKLSLWLAEHQMNVDFKNVFGETRPTLPLQNSGNIVCGNATRLDWESVCPKDKTEIYIFGNPPYLGTRNQEKIHKSDIDYVFKHFGKRRKLDYIANWFYLAANYFDTTRGAFAFVTTNSICQGEQVSILWPLILNNNKLISFAHQSFKWTNNAKGNAGVSVVIMGVSNKKDKNKKLFINNIVNKVKEINPYLCASPTIYIESRKKALSLLPDIVRGNYTGCCGALILTTIEKNKIEKNNTDARKFIKRLIGSSEYINGIKRYCLWIEDSDLEKALKINEIRERIKNVENERSNSSDKGQNRLVHKSHQFREFNQTSTNSIIIPVVSSGNRDYIPSGFITKDEIVPNSAQIIYDCDAWVFGLISSKIHMVWVLALAGRLRNDIRYSSSICYNTFPFPEISEEQKLTLEGNVFSVLDERQKHSEKTMAELYDPDKMPISLKQAHHDMDIAVEQCYRSKPFSTDEERLEYLFKLYEEMIEAEREKTCLI